MFFGWVKGEESKTKRKAIKRVLVVEDEPLVAFDNEYVLEQAGYEIAATVNDYAHAIDVIEQDAVDLVIADVALHGDKNGIDVARHASDRGLPVLFVTGACPTQAKALAVGCLAKPYAPRDLVAAIAVIDARLRGLAPPRGPEGLHLFQDAA